MCPHLYSHLYLRLNLFLYNYFHLNTFLVESTFVRIDDTQQLCLYTHYHNPNTYQLRNIKKDRFRHRLPAFQASPPTQQLEAGDASNDSNTNPLSISNSASWNLNANANSNLNCLKEGLLKVRDVQPQTKSNRSVFP